MSATLAPLDALFTRTQRRLLALLFAVPGEHSLSALVRLSGGGSGAIRREVERLLRAGLVRERHAGNRRLIAADASSPCYAALQALAGISPRPLPRRDAVRPSTALIARRGAVLKTLARHGLSRPRVFGSVARGGDTAASDLDLLVRAAPRASLLDLAKAQRALDEVLGARVDLVTVEDLPEEWRRAALAEAVPL